jgi:RNA polymerase sigma factor (TIGR02999 family)
MGETSADITLLLRSASSGDRDVVDALMAAIYDDLRRLAVNHMKTERADHTLQPTALVHEAYMKLIDQHATNWSDRVHFFAVASRVIRRILVDHARQRGAAKRGAGRDRIVAEIADIPKASNDVDLVCLDEALTELAAIDEQQAGIVEMRYFGGLNLGEIAEALSIGKRSVDRQWSIAKAWLCFRMADSGSVEIDG